MRVGGVINVNTTRVSDFLRSFGVTWRTTRITVSVVVASVAVGVVMHTYTYRPPAVAGSDPLPIEDAAVSDATVAGAQAPSPTVYVPRPAAYNIPAPQDPLVPSPVPQPAPARKPSAQPPAPNGAPEKVAPASPLPPADTAPKPHFPHEAPTPPLPPIPARAPDTVEGVVGGLVGVVGGVLGSLTGR